MKTYIKPTTTVVRIQHVNVIATSFKLNSAAASTTGDNYNSLGREDNSWDIWGNDDYED